MTRAELTAMLHGLERIEVTINELYVTRRVFSRATVSRLLKNVQQMKKLVTDAMEQTNA